jgi:hypothetical protein
MNNNFPCDKENASSDNEERIGSRKDDNETPREEDSSDILDPDYILLTLCIERMEHPQDNIEMEATTRLNTNIGNASSFFRNIVTQPLDAFRIVREDLAAFISTSHLEGPMYSFSTGLALMGISAFSGLTATSSKEESYALESYCVGSMLVSVGAIAIIRYLFNENNREENMREL